VTALIHGELIEGVCALDACEIALRLDALVGRNHLPIVTAEST